MKKTILSLSILIYSFTGYSQDYSDGLFMVNEGNFGSFDGDLSFYDNETQTIYEDVFQTENPSEDGFDVLQDFEIFEDKAFFLSKGASDNKIAIVDVVDFILNTSIDLATAGPQSITRISDSKAYVSCANAPNLRILDIEDESMIGSVSSSIGSFSSQDYIAVYGTSAYIFMGDKLGVIDTDVDSASADIELIDAEVSCSGMQVIGDKLFVLTNSGWSGASSRIFRIDLTTNEVELNLDLSALGKARLLQNDASSLYFMVGSDVYKMGLEDDLAPTDTFTSSSYEDSWDLAYGKSFYVNANTDQIFIGSAEGFVSDATYEVLDLSDGSSISTLNASGGVGLNQFEGGLTVVGLNELKSIDFTFYPNPAKEFLMVEFLKEENLNYTLMSIDGSVVKAGSIFGSRERIDLVGLEKGIYILNLFSSELSASKKIIIQ